MIDFGVTQIFIGQRPQAVYGVFHGKLASRTCFNMLVISSGLKVFLRRGDAPSFNTHHSPPRIEEFLWPVSLGVDC